MDLPRKMTIVETAIRSLSTHDDEDAAVLKARLDDVIAFATAEKEAIDERVAARIAATAGAE